MDKDDIVSFEIIIATTGECFVVNEAPLSSTVKEIMDAFFKHRILDSDFGLGWKFTFCGRIIDDKTTLCKIFATSENRVIQLIAKVAGA